MDVVNVHFHLHIFVATYRSHTLSATSVQYMSYSEVNLLHGIHSQVCVFSHEPGERSVNHTEKINTRQTLGGSPGTSPFYISVQVCYMEVSSPGQYKQKQHTVLFPDNWAHQCI